MAARAARNYSYRRRPGLVELGARWQLTQVRQYPVFRRLSRDCGRSRFSYSAWAWRSCLSITVIRSFPEKQLFINAFKELGLPRYLVYMVGTIEVFGGLMMLLGLFTPVAGLLLFLDMCGAMRKYNFSEGISAVREYELPLVLALAALTLAAIGAGSLSLDDLISRKRNGWHGPKNRVA